MGIDYTTYVGPFMRCRYHMVQRSETRYSCTNPKCPRNGRDGTGFSFCPACGAPVAGIAWATDVPSVDHWEVFEGLPEPEAMDEYHSDSCPDDSEHWYVPSVARGEPREFFIRDDDDPGIVATGINPASEMEWLHKAFAPEIQRLRERYGTATTEWGIIRHAS